VWWVHRRQDHAEDPKLLEVAGAELAGSPSQQIEPVGVGASH